MLNKTNLTKLGTLVIALSAPLLSRGQSEDGPVFELAPFSVMGETYAFGAQKIYVVDDDQLENRIAGSLSDIFANSPSIHVGGAFGPAEKIYIRGIEDKLFNITIDGATQAGYLSHHHGQYSIEPELIKRVIVEPGAGSAASGLGALAGTMQFQTKRAADFLEPGQSAGAFTKVSYAENADEIKGTGAGYGKLGTDWEFLVAYTRAESEDYEDGKGQTVDYTGSDKSRLFASLDGTLQKHHRLGLSFEKNLTEGTFRHRPNFVGYFNHPLAPNIPVYMEIGRETIVADYGYIPDDDSFSGSAKLFYTDFTIDRPSQYEMGYESLGFNTSAETEIREHSLTFGFDFRADTASFTGKGSAQGFASTLDYTTIDDETIDLYGIYIQDSWRIRDNIQAAFGLRLDQSDYTDKDDLNYSDHGFSPNAGISFGLTDNLDLNLSYSRAFRGVTPIDVITANEGSVANAPKIDPETADNWEVGFQYALGNFFANGTYFFQEIDDVIVNSQGIRDNGGELQSDGYDILVGTRYKGWTASFGLSHAKPELNGEQLVDAEFGVGTGYGRVWNVNLEYDVDPLSCTIGWSYKHVDAFDESANPLAHKEEYNVHGLYLRWSGGSDDQYSLIVSARNLFDEHYVDHATSGYNSRLERVAGLPAPGRDLRIAGTCTF